jgi:DNA polymerase-3 subunit delta'
LTEETSLKQQTNPLSGDMQGIPDWTRVAQFLERLVLHPPKVLLLEGGTAGEREYVALYWAAGLNCTEAQKPCARCLPCRRVFDREFTDLHYLDGREGRIGIDAVRELRPLLGQAPYGGGRRVIIFGEAQELTPEAANALLKSMEDTDIRNFFVLLAPQRERLLPTLVSRSWVLTLGWPGATRGALAMPGEKERSAESEEWLEAMAAFLHSGQGWFARTMVKSQVDKTLAAGLIVECRRSLIQAMLGSPREKLAIFFYEQGSPQLWRDLDLRLHQAEQGLMAQVSPALVLDWLVTGMRLRMRL